MSDDKNEIITTDQVSVNKDHSLHAIVSEELTRLGETRRWAWKLFLLCLTPNILNGFHVSSYVFLGKLPDSHWCAIPEITTNTNWTVDQMRTISSIDNGLGDGCKILDWNYAHLSSMSFDESIVYTQSQPRPAEISCPQHDGGHQEYVYKEGNSIVAEWDLLCDRSVYRTIVQVAVTLGKFSGAALFGVISDKFGRRTAVGIGGMIFLTGSILTSFVPWYWIFLLGRYMLGFATGALFYAAFALLTENIGIKYRSWMSIAYTMSYPIGMLYLALAANFLHDWRQIQLSLTIPAFSLFFFIYFLKESPRWLLSKGREEDAYKIVFKQKKGVELPKKRKSINFDDSKKISVGQKFQNIFRELSGLYCSSRYSRHVLICNFSFFVCSLCYYVTALNADNLSANRVVYVASTGCVDIIAYIVPIFILKFVGRRYSSFMLFSFSGICMLTLLAIPQESVSWIVVVAMLGRFGVSAVYAIVTLHTAEIFPTELRSSALGMSSTISHVASSTAPFVVDFLGAWLWYVPTTVCGIAVILAGLLALTLPETSDKVLEDPEKSV